LLIIRSLGRKGIDCKNKPEIVHVYRQRYCAYHKHAQNIKEYDPRYCGGKLGRPTEGL